MAHDMLSTAAPAGGGEAMVPRFLDRALDRVTCAARRAGRQVHLSVTDRCFPVCPLRHLQEQDADLPEAVWAETIDRLAERVRARRDELRWW